MSVGDVRSRYTHGAGGLSGSHSFTVAPGRDGERGRLRRKWFEDRDGERGRLQRKGLKTQQRGKEMCEGRGGDYRGLVVC